MVHFPIAMLNYQRVSKGPSWNIIFHAQKVSHVIRKWDTRFTFGGPIVWMEEILHQLIGGLSQYFIIQRLSTIQGGARLLPSTIMIRITIWDTPFRDTPRNRLLLQRVRWILHGTWVPSPSGVAHGSLLPISTVTHGTGAGNVGIPGRLLR